MQWQGAFCGVVEAQARVVEDEAQWKRLWKDIGAEEPGVPDFKARFAVAVFLGQRNTGGYAARLMEPESAGGATVVRYKVSAPKGLVIQAITQPYHVRLYPRAGLTILRLTRASGSSAISVSIPERSCRSCGCITRPSAPHPESRY